MLIFVKGTKKNGDVVWFNVAQLMSMTDHRDKKTGDRYTIVAMTHGVGQQATFVQETPEILMMTARAARIGETKEGSLAQ